MRSTIYGRSGCRCEELRHAACILRRAPSNARHPLLGGFVSEGTRPGGLTALAVLNFLLGAWQLLHTGGQLVMRFFADRIKDEEVRQLAEALKAASPMELIAMVTSSAIASLLMIVAGVGYLQQRRTMGRRVGNVACLTMIVAVALEQNLLSGTDGGFGFGTIPAVLYPVLSLFLLNTTFKEDFIR
jgi:hypothetical protein